MKIFKGKVLSTKLPKSASVAVERMLVHPLYRKRFKRIKKYLVHDEIGVKVGDMVEFIATRPISATKKWKIIVSGSKSGAVKSKTNEKIVGKEKKK